MALLKDNLGNSNPVGIFDSGLGGLSVLRHIQEQLPNESLCYFADSGFAPYGDRPEEEVIARTLFAADYLVQQGVKAIVVACNTATAVTIKLIRAHYPDLVLVGVEPGLKPAASMSKNGCIGVIATSRTLASAKYQTLCERIQHEMQVRFINQACPGLADQIERGELDSPHTLALLRDYLQPIFAAGADTLVLGCTHYPFVENSILRIVDEESKTSIQLVDTGAAIARQLNRLLKERELANLHNTTTPIRFTTSGEVKQLEFVLDKLLNLKPGQYAMTQSHFNRGYA